MIHERDYLRLKRSMIYASGDSCGKSQAIVATIRSKWMHSSDKRDSQRNAAASPALAPAAPSHFRPRARLPARER